MYSPRMRQSRVTYKQYSRVNGKGVSAHAIKAYAELRYSSTLNLGIIWGKWLVPMPDRFTTEDPYCSIVRTSIHYH